ncbi:AIPR family protein [Streptomyces sp. NPDC127092]|uniref:AIPR family protein n=1 Tax=Streptomyces sp. NPDC127092 TaxID=3347135 RepID=UPI0036640542
MSKAAQPVSNEVMLLTERLKQSKAETYPDISDQDYFLISSTDTVLRHKGLSSRQIEDGITDGTNDGGIDAVYLFVDGQIVEDASEATHGTNTPQLELEIIQTKDESGFKEIPLQLLIDHLPVLLRLDRPDGLEEEFNPRLLERFDSFRDIYLAASSRFPALSISIRYVTRSSEIPHTKVKRKAARLEKSIAELFPDAKVAVDLIGAGDLNTLARQRKSNTLTLRLSESPMSPEKGGFVSLVRLEDYNSFITDENGRLRDEIFEENVRGYEGATVINRGIAESLRQGDDADADFWWLNNGVTVIGKRVQPSGKMLHIEDPQIVNGLQTSRNVHEYFRPHRPSPDSVGTRPEGRMRQILVRVVETRDEAITAQVIKATNSQNRVSAASLRSGDPFQRSIEEYFQRQGFYYERKRNHYKNLGKPRTQIVEVLELAQAVGAILLQQPHIARGAPSSLVRGKYERVFKNTTPLEAYLRSVLVMRSIDDFLPSVAGLSGAYDRSNVRFHLARAATAFALRSSRPQGKAVAGLDISLLDAAFLERVYEWVIERRDAAAKATDVHDLGVLAKGGEWATEIDKRLSKYTDKTRWPVTLTPPRSA